VIESYILHQNLQKRHVYICFKVIFSLKLVRKIVISKNLNTQFLVPHTLHIAVK